MDDVPVPHNEDERLDALHRLNALLGPTDEDTLEDVSKLARALFQVDMAGVTLLDWDQQWFKAIAGGSPERTVPREQSFSTHAILKDEVLVVEDVAADERFSGEEFSAFVDGVRFYAGAPLVVEGAHRVGALCLWHSEPRSFSEEDRQVLLMQADLVVDIFESQRDAHQVEYLKSALEEAQEPVLITEGSPIDPPGPRIVWMNDAFSQLTGYTREDLIGQTPRILQGEETSRAALDRVRTALNQGEPVQAETVNYRKDGSSYIVSWQIAPVFNEANELTHWVSIQHDVTEQRRREERLKHEATHDTLTGLPNRRVLEEEVHAMIEEEAADLSALLYLDLDRFKLVNDSLGHSKGDRLLQEVATILMNAVRDQDMVSRLGGDEFAICLPNLRSPEDAYQIAERIHEELNRPLSLDEQIVYTPASIGVLIGVAEYDGVEDALRAADTAMYEAKEEFHEPFIVYEPSMTQKVEEQLSLDTELRQAVERGDFAPYFQPIVDLTDGSLQGFEVLARWKHRDEGLLSPEDFLDSAEMTGLIVPIGRQVMEKACEFVQELTRRDDRSYSFALNANFAREEFFRTETHSLLNQMLEKYDIPPSEFTMEISERTVEGISQDDKSAIYDLKELGVDIVLDDFGTGFSSLQSLRRLPVDGLKIDKEFLNGTEDEGWDRDMVELVITIGHTFEKSITAEGVDTERQLTILREAGCTYGQGFLFTPPVPAHEVEQIFEDPPWTSYWASTSASG